MPFDWPYAFAVASLAFAFAIYFSLKAWFAHRERMAKIEKGIDPDEPSPKDASK